MEKFGQKLKQLIKEEHKTVSAFAKKIDMNYTQVSRYLNGDKPSVDFLEIVMREFPTLDLNWLLREDSRTDLKLLNETQVEYESPVNNEDLIMGMEKLLSQLKSNLAQK